jgi:hypothetical protein
MVAGSAMAAMPPVPLPSAAPPAARRAALLDVAVAAAAAAQAACLATLAPCFARFLRAEFVRVSAGVRSASAGAGDLPLLFGVHAGEATSLAATAVVAVVALVLVAIGHVVLLSVGWNRGGLATRSDAGPLEKAAATFMPSTQPASTHDRALLMRG